jgi:hypothetical protein
MEDTAADGVAVKVKTKGPRRVMHRSNLRAFVLEAARAAHPFWDVNRVTPEFMDLVEYKVQAMLRASLKQHPPQGKTVRDLY